MNAKFFKRDAFGRDERPSPQRGMEMTMDILSQGAKTG
jgi:hypothetical protein